MDFVNAYGLPMKPYRVKNGVYYFHFRVRIGGISKSKSTSYPYKPTKREFSRDYMEWKDSLVRQKELKKTSNEIFFDFLESKGSDYTRYSSHYKDIPTFLYGKKIEEIKKNDILNYWEYLLKNNKSGSTAKRKFAILSSFFSWCTEREYININPCVLIKKKVKENRRIGFLSQDQKKEILEKSKKIPYLHLAICISMYTGLRKGEVLSLRWDWIDIDRKVLTLPMEKTKNKKGLIVSLSEKICKILSENKGKNNVYVVELNGKPIKEINRSFNTLRKKLSFQTLGYGETFVFHHIRHTFATELAQSGLPLHEVMDALNHSDIKTTLRYAHSSGRGVSEMIDKINKDL